MKIEKQNNKGKKKVKIKRIELAEDQILQIPEIVKKRDEIILHKSQETVEELEIKINDKINKKGK